MRDAPIIAPPRTTPLPPARADAAPAWNRRPERGSGWLVALMVWLTLHLGWRVGRALLIPITAYFVVAAPSARRASLRFLRRALGREPGMIARFRHVFAFSTMLLDRIFFLAGRTEGYRFEADGVAALEATLAEGRGVILLGAHLGSFEALRAFGRNAPVPVRMMMHHAKHGGVSRRLERLDPDFAAAVIRLGTPEAMLAAREALARGEILGILADRAPDPTLAPERMLRVPFLGAPAAFPTGPFRLAGALGAPVLLFFGPCIGKRRYALHFEPFATRIDLPRAGREAALARSIGAYADRLGAMARAHPYQWFNFHDVWEDAPDAGAG